MKKVYELKNMNGYHLVTTYMGVRVEAEFKGGNFFAGKGGRVVTSNPFVQDALENDARFGKMYVLKEKYEDESDKVEKVKDDPKIGSKSKVKIGSKSKTKVADGIENTQVETVESVKTFNDACDYFADKGEVCESAEDIEECCKKFGVEFPNLNI